MAADGGDNTSKQMERKTMPVTSEASPAKKIEMSSPKESAVSAASASSSTTEPLLQTIPATQSTHRVSIYTTPKDSTDVPAGFH